MFKILLPSFSDELLKIAKVDPQGKANVHFEQEVKNWDAFEKNLKAKGFQKAILQHPEADAKLKRYVKNFGGYVGSKDVVGKVSSRTKFRNYTIKRLPSGRLGCNCKDWQYNHSTKNSDCFHIQDLRAHGMEKTSNVGFQLARGGIGLRHLEKGHSEAAKGRIAKENVRRLHAGEPLLQYMRGA
jgi:hypothetical protein